MPRPLAVTLALALAALCCPAASADQAWPVARGPSREPSPYRFDRKSLKLVPRAFLEDAAAVVLYAGSNYLVEKDGTLETVTHEITRLNGRKGIEKLGEFRNLTYTPSHQKVTLHLARIHKHDGKIIDVQPRHVHLRDVGTDYQVYDPEKQLIISFPSLEVGDVIEVKWTVRGKNPEHAGQFFNRYSFGDTASPVLLDELRVRVPRDVTLKHATVHGKADPLVREEDGQRLYVWRNSHVPAPPKDDDLPSREELRTSVVLSTFTTWQQVGDWKAKLRNECWKCTPKIKKIVEDVTKEHKTPTEKARALTYWVRRNLRYVSAGEKHDFTPHLPEDVLANRYGDCKDTSQLLATMLREAGITVELATLGVLDDGQIQPDVPSPWGTHAILMATIDGKQHWIDTTARLAGWDVLPKDDLDRLCYLTDDKGKVRLVRTPAATAAMTRTEQVTEIWVAPSGDSRCKRTAISEGLAAILQRDRFLDVPAGERRHQVTAELQDANSRTRLIELKVDEKALNDFGEPVRVSMVFDVPRHFTGNPEKEGSVTDSRIWARLLSHNIDHERKTPMVLPGPFESVHTYRFHLPPAFVLDSLPVGKRVTSWWGTFETTVKSLDGDGNVRNVEVTFHTKLDRARIEKDDLDGFRRFHEDVNREYRVWLTMKPATDLTSAEMMENLVAVSPQNAFTAATLARIYHKADRLADARRVLERACFYTPDDEALWELRVTTADSPQQEEQAQRELVKRFPENRGHALALGRILVSQGKQDEARKLLSELTKQRGTSDAEKAKAHYQLARSYYRRDESKEALAELDAARKLDLATASTVHAFMLRGQVLEDLKRPADAIAAYRLALITEPKSQEVLLALVRLCLQTKDELGALDTLRRYVLLVDRDVAGLVLAAETYLQMRRYDEAFELAMKAREINFHEKAQRILGLVFLQRGDDEKAIFHLSKADADSVVMTALLRATINAGKLDDLDAVVEKAEKVKASGTLKQVIEAGKALLARRKALDKRVTIPNGKESEYAAALDALALAEDAKGRGKPFAALLEKALKVEVGPAYGLRGRVEVERGRLRQALADANKAIALSPKDANGYYVRGRVREEREQDGGLDDLRKAAELSAKQDADVLFALSQALLRAGEKTEATDAAKEALKLRPKDAELATHLAALER
jgi:tetratricopeptide (TPR) repeat protein